MQRDHKLFSIPFPISPSPSLPPPLSSRAEENVGKQKQKAKRKTKADRSLCPRQLGNDAPRPGRALQPRHLRLAALEPERAGTRDRRGRAASPLVVRRQRLGPASRLRIFFFFSQGNQQGLAPFEVVVAVVVVIVVILGGEKRKRNTRTVRFFLVQKKKKKKRKPRKMSGTNFFLTLISIVPDSIGRGRDRESRR